MVHQMLVLCALVAVVGTVLAAPHAQNAQNGQNAQDVQLLRYDSNNDGLGAYSFDYEQKDSHKRNADGELRNAGSEDASAAMKGLYTWIGPDGVTYTVNYTADENDYQPTIRSPLGGASARIDSILG